ncbi:MAG: helix-turn-helix transcriptional regulator [Deltaproteobacteria bacterium]|jgi:transcriptional regulator with XRE-family HTH domain|nr:helix-turn-helix transcriptional regulator [Deltaproteobacteria bacterium]
MQKKGLKRGLLNSYQIAAVTVIRNSRIKKKITQLELAKSVGISQSYMASIENYLLFPAEQTLDKLFQVLEIKNIDNIKPKKSRIDKLPLSNTLIHDKIEAELLNRNPKKFFCLSDNVSKFINKFPDYLYYSYIFNDDSLYPLIKKDNIIIIQYLGLELNKIGHSLLNDSLIICYNENKNEFVISRLNLNSEVPAIFFIQPVNPDDYYYEIKESSYSRFKIDPETKKIYDLKKDKGQWIIAGIIIFIVDEKQVGDIVYLS